MAVNEAAMNELAAQQEAIQKRIVAMTPSWKKTQNGGIKTTSIVNIQMAIEFDPLLKGCLAYNEFTWEVEVTRDVPALHLKKGQMLDMYDSMILSELEHVWDVVFSGQAFTHGVMVEAQKASYNPVQDYLNNAYANWDKRPRIKTFMNTFLGVAITPVNELIFTHWLVGACTKAFDPSAKFDYVLDLVGAQGSGKTTLLKKLSHGWYTDQFQNYADKDYYSAMLRAWIVNDDEMAATAASTFEELKKFISATQLEFRPAYGRIAVRRDKGFVMARTTNELHYLKDKTGERRFLPLLADFEQQKKHPVSDLTDEIVEQIWGEAMHLYHSDFDTELTHEQELELNIHRDQFTYIDAVEEQIELVLEKWDSDFISSTEIAKGIGVNDLLKSPKISKKIKYIMDNRRDWKVGNRKRMGVSRRGWRRI